MARTSRETRTIRPAARRRPAKAASGKAGQPSAPLRPARPPIIMAICTTRLLKAAERVLERDGLAGPDVARGGARGRRVACRADPSFRRSHRAAQRTRRDRLPAVQRGHGRGSASETLPLMKGMAQRQGLCRLCAGASRHVRADVPYRAARHDAAVAARGGDRLFRRIGQRGRRRPQRKAPGEALEALSLDQAAAIARAWSLVHGFTTLLLDGRLKDILHRLPEAPASTSCYMRCCSRPSRRRRGLEPFRF